MTHKETLQQRDIQRRIQTNNVRLQELNKEWFQPFRVECVDDDDYYHEWMGNSKIKRSNLSCIISWEQYTIDDIMTTREWKQMRRIGKGYYDPSRFIVLD